MGGLIECRFFFAEGLKKEIAFSLEAWSLLQEGIDRACESVGFAIGKSFDFAKAVPKAFENDDELCEFARDHNRFVGWLWDSIQEFGDKPCEDNPVMLTDAYFKSIHAILKEVKVPIDRWSKDHYIDRMEAMFGIMTGNDADGIEFGSAPLTPEQAGSVIWLMDAMFGIDQHQADLEVPKGCDYLLANEDYHWCENCGAVTYEDTHYGKDGDIACDFCESDNQEEEE